MLIRRIWRKQPGKHFVICTKSATGKWKEHWFDRSELGDLDEFLERNLDKDIYFCPHGFKARERKKEFAVPPLLMWADLDEVDPRECKPRPTIALESSPGRHVGFWLVDKPVSDLVNRQLTYAIGADRGGWDFTQVLRVPETFNYKYKSHPKVRLLWDNGPIYSLEDITEKFPKVKKVESEGDRVISAQEVLDRYEKIIPRSIRREIVNAKPVAGKRSDMIWKLHHNLFELGLSGSEIMVLIKASGWNKFRGRADEDAQLEREIKKVVTERLDTNLKVPEANGYQYLSKSMDQVEIEDIDWIWYPYLARGELTILEGDPGIGKSWLAQYIAGTICAGGKLPGPKGDTRVKQGRIAYFDIENRSGAVTKPRLLDMGIPESALKYYRQEEEPFTVDDVEKFDEVLDAIEAWKPELVVFDTINTYIGRADTYKSSEAQQAFNNFRLIASRFNCAVITLRHLTKGSTGNALYRGQGSIAFTGVARIVASVGYVPDSEDGELAVAVTKNNLAKKPAALTFRIESLPDTLKRTDRAKIKWGDYREGIAADDILIPKPKETTSISQSAHEFLIEFLDDGPQETANIIKAAEKRGISRTTLYRAKDAFVKAGTLKVDRRGKGKEHQSFWSMEEGGRIPVEKKKHMKGTGNAKR